MLLYSEEGLSTWSCSQALWDNGNGNPPSTFEIARRAGLLEADSFKEGPIKDTIVLELSALILYSLVIMQAFDQVSEKENLSPDIEIYILTTTDIRAKLFVIRKFSFMFSIKSSILIEIKYKSEYIYNKKSIHFHYNQNIRRNVQNNI